MHSGGRGTRAISHPREFSAVFKLILAALLFILLLPQAFAVSGSSIIPLGQEYRFRVAENDSLRGVDRISEQFPFAGCGSIPNDYEGKCGAFVYDFCIESSDYISSHVQLTPEERSGALKGAYDSLVSSDVQLQKLKERWFNFFLTSFNCTINTEFVSSAFSFPTYLASCNDVLKDQIIDLLFGDFWVDALVGVDNYFFPQASAYGNGAKSLNLLMSELEKQADSLYYEGAGYANYSTRSSSFYDSRIKSFISDYRSGWIDSGRDSYPYLYLKHISVLANRDSRVLSNCELGAMHSGTYFSAFNYVLGLYRDTLSQRAQLKSDYEFMLSQAKKRYDEAGLKLDYLYGNEYHLVDSRIISYASDEYQTTTLEFDLGQVPSNAIASIDSSLHGSGSETGAELLLSQAQQGVQEKIMFHYAIGTESLSSSISLSDRALNLSESVEARVSEILTLLEEKTAQKLSQTRKDIDSYSVWDIATASVSDSVVRKFNTASDLYNEYDPAEISKGSRISNLYSACVILDEIGETVSTKAWDVKSEKIKELNSSVLGLNWVIQRAKLDGVDVFSEEKLSESKSILLSLNSLNITFIDESIAEIENATDAIYLRAGMQYADLKDTRSEIYSLFNSLSDYIDLSKRVPGIELTLDAHEAYISGNDFVPEKTLGRYLAIKTECQAILDKLDSKASVILGEYLSQRYRLTNSFDSVPEVGSLVNVTSYLELSNGLQLSSSKPVTVQIENIPFAVNSVVHSDHSGVYATKNGSGLLIYISNLSRNMTYYISIKTSVKPAVLSSKSAKRVSLSETRLVEKMTYNIDSSFDTESLILSDGYDADSCSVYMDGRLQSVRSYSNLSVLLSGVKAGRSVVEATCVKNKPISFLSSNFTEEDNYVRYLLRLKSNYGDFEGVDYILQLLGSASEIDPNSIRVAKESGKVPNNYSSYKLGDKYYAKWSIPVLSSEYINYTVQYRVTDTVSYYYSFKQEVENSSYYEAVDVSNFLRDAEYKASTGDYNTAIDYLEKAKKKITLARNEKIENDSLTERLDWISSRISELKNKSAEIYAISSNLSLSGVSVEVAKQIAEYDSQVKNARALLDSGDVSGAKSIIKDLERLVSSTKIDDAIYSKEKKVTDELFGMQNLIFKLGRFTGIEILLEKVDSIRLNLSAVAPATAVSDYYSALSNLNDAAVRLDELDGEVDVHSESASAYFSSTLGSAKTAIDAWKKRKPAIAGTFSVSKGNPIQSIPSSVVQLVSDVNETESSAAELTRLYGKLKGYETEEMLANLDEFEELRSLSENVSSSTAYLSDFTSRYKETSNELIKDVAALFGDKLKSGSGEEKRTINELQPFFSSAKTAYNNGMYLDSMLLSNYIQKSVLSAGEGKIEPFDPIFIYLGILVGALAVVVYAFTKREPPRELKKIEKIRLD